MDPMEIAASLVCVLLFLLGLLVVVAAVGHGLWVLSAQVWRALGGRGNSDQGAAAPCRRCGALLVGGRCVVCDWPGPLAMQPRPAAALIALRRMATRFHELRLIDARLLARVTDWLEAERVRATQPVQAEVAAELAREAVSTAPQPAAAASAVPTGAAAGSTRPAEAVASPFGPVAAPEAAQPAEPAERVRRFVEGEKQREALASSAPPRPAARPVSQLLAAFMEEKNIRWGELVGGLLIVCCSIALVLSFWSAIAERALMKFVVFNGVTAGLFGIGFYTHRRWRLPTTSHGLFMTAALLVPLNFLAIAAFARETAVTPLVLAGELISIALFAALVYLAGKVIVARAPLSLALGVVGPAASELLVRRWIGPGSEGAVLLAVAALPLACYLGALAPPLWRVSRRGELREEEANELFRLLGPAAFATLVPLGLLVARSEPAAALQELAPLTALLGAPALAAGLLLWRRINEPAMTGYRVAGTSIAVFGVLVMLSGLAFAWPEPGLLLPVAALNFLVLTVVALACGIPAAHLLAGACLLFGYLVGWQLVLGTVSWRGETGDVLLRALFSASSGIALTAIALPLAGAAGAWARRGRWLDALFYALIAGAAAALSLALVSWHGLAVPGDPYGAAWIYGLYASLALVAAAISRRGEAAWAGSALLLAALVQGVVFMLADQAGLEHPWAAALLLHGTIVAVLASIALRVRRLSVPFDRPLSISALATSAAALPFLLWAARTSAAGPVAVHLFWLAAVWLLVAWLRGWRPLFTAFQAALAGAVLLAVTAQLQAQAWYQQAEFGWLDPWSLQAYGVALAGLSLAWVGLRLVVLRLGAFRGENQTVPAEHLAPQPGLSRLGWLVAGAARPTFDRAVLFLVLLGLVGLASYGALPGAAQELSPRSLAVRLEGARRAGEAATAPSVDQPAENSRAEAARRRVVPAARHFELAHLPHGHALGAGSWILLAVVMLALAASQWERFEGANLLGLLLAAAAAVPLLAGRWEAEVAVASALRWYTAGFVALASIAIWSRRPLAIWARRVGWRGVEADHPPLEAAAITLALALAALPLVAMGLFVGIAALANRPIEAQLRELWTGVAVVFVVLGLVALVIRLLSGKLNSSRPTLDSLSPLGSADSRNPTAVPGTSRLGMSWAGPASTLLLVLGAAPLVAVSLYAVSAALQGNPIVGPDPGSFFARIGLAVSYTVPALVLALALVGYALREASPRFAFAAGLLFNASATAGFLLSAARGGAPLDEVLWARLALINAVVAAVYGLAWLSTAAVWARRQGRQPGIEGLLVVQACWAVALVTLVLVPAAAALWFDPLPRAVHVDIGSWLGWVATGLAAGLVVWLDRLAGRRASPGMACAGLLAFGALAALTACRWDTANWLGHQVLMGVAAATGWLLLGGGWLGVSDWRTSQRNGVTRWAALAGLLAVLFALRGFDGAPSSAGPVAGLAVASALAAALAWWSAHGTFLYVAGALLNLAASFWWVKSGQFAWANFPNELVELAQLNVIVLALPVVGWLLIELRGIRPQRAGSPFPRIWPLHRVAAALSLVGLAGLVALGLLADAFQGPLEPRPWLGWLALGAVLTAASALLWDERAQESVASLYLVGFVAIGMAVDGFNLQPQMLGWTMTMLAAAYSLATSYLWSRRQGLAEFAEQLGIPRRDDPLAGLAWLVPANGVLIAAVLLAAGWIVLTFSDHADRLLAAKATVAQVVAVGLLARGERRSRLQQVTLVLGVLGAILWGWAWLDPATTGTLLNRAVVTMVALAAMTGVYGLGLAKLGPWMIEWARAARRLVPALVAATAASVVFILSVEAIYYFERQAVPIAWPALVAVVFGLAWLVIAALAAALLPGRDPLGLSERGRTAYVYAAEATLALLVAHVRLTMPWLFSGFFTRYWPFLVMLVAFLGVGFSELFRRRQQRVLAEPLEHTAALLPLLPVAGFWLLPSAGHYSAVLLAVGGLYAALAVMRKSFGFGLLAALAANGSLWYLLSRADGYGLLEHPQFWLIPPALCVLAAAYLNRSRLEESQMAAVRYLAATAIYVSSTADIFLNGVAQAPWLPLVLAALSIAGIFAGILLRVRGFLFLGMSFLMLALLSVIWYAAHDLEQTWVWFASGIVAGALIIFLFGLFEKKRQEVLKLVEQLREWEP